MKKLFTLSIAVFAMSTVFAQRSIDLSVDMTQPTSGQTVTAGVQFPFSFVVTNNGTDTLKTSDSVLYTFTGTSSVYFRTNRNLNPGDTMQFNTGLTFVATAPNGPLNFCVAVNPLNRFNPIMDTDTSNNVSCTNITITGSTGIGVLEAFASDRVLSKQLSITPNPAVNNSINFDFVAQNNSNVTVRVIDITGRVVMNHAYGKAYVGQKNYNLDISNLPDGFYVVEIRQDGVRSVGKLSRQ